ncbi:uncharacterized protein LOC62_07G009621 [Vanrija pseudolonga]|uniref:Uncharacterized protein n=1 Tax=Vanrija pseudolonga TaxID=143232 RepID=A0AAF0YGE2_9TREE|nr:hypothetical protein LOC62_07G009621 [Vanrija pseudolonga]
MTAQQRLLRPLSAGLRSARPRALHTSVRRLAPQRPPPPTRLEPLRMPADMPREDYAAPAAYTLSLMGRVIKYLVVGGATLAVIAIASYEGTHLYVEHVVLAAPSRSADDEAYGWADENQGWTGGQRGGTDPALGFRARHALRAAWIAWEWGAGDTASTIAKAAGHYAGNNSIHPEIRRPSTPSGSVNTVDRGYQLADEYIEAAIAAARRRGFAFPPELDPTRPAGPPAVNPHDDLVPSSHADATALDLLMLKAGVLERIGTRDAVSHAREVYEQVLAARLGEKHDLPVPKARLMRLAHKLGDLAQRHGDAAEAEAWWAWGLARAGLDLPQIKASVPASSSGGSWWWPFGGSKAAAAEAAAPQHPLHTALPPPVLRAATNLLISASAADAQTATPAGLDAAAAVQALALSLLPHPKSVAIPATSTGPTVLQETWEQQRAALVTLHKASVSHARKDASADPLELASSAADAAEAVLSTLTPSLPSAFTSPSSNPLAQPSKRLLRDTLSTAAEASFTRAVLLERRANLVTSRDDKIHCLEHAGEAYERAMSLAAAENGTTDAKSKKEEDAVGRGEDWTRFWTGYVRANEKIMKIVSEDEDKKGKGKEVKKTEKGKEEKTGKEDKK